MPIVKPIHWEEGLFLQPHHLQLMQQHQVNCVSTERQLNWTYPYGLVDFWVNPDDLAKMLVRLERLHAIMPSGVEIRFPGNADLPTLDIKRALASGSVTVYLGVPLWSSHRANTVERGIEDAWRVKRIFKIDEVEARDENTGENPKPLAVRKINARLMLEDDDRTDMEVLPLFKVSVSVGSNLGVPRIDANYYPPCLVIHGFPAIRDLLRDLASQVVASRSQCAMQMARAGFSIDSMRGPQFEQSMRLRTLNRFAGRLPALADAPNISPFLMYLELRELLGELVALDPHRDAFDVPSYDHDNLILSFTELTQRIRDLVRGSVKDKWIKVDFVREGRVFISKLNDSHFSDPSDYYIAVRSRSDSVEIVRLVTNEVKFKLKASSQISAAVEGLTLTDVRVPPMSLPTEAGLCYFRIGREKTRVWEECRKMKNITAVWPGMEATDFSLSLYMIIPD